MVNGEWRDAMKRRLMLLLATSVLALSGCSNNVSPVENKPYATIMIYMCGADLESATDGYSSKPVGLATADLKEILSVKNQPDDVNIIVQTGGASKWSSSLGISARELGRYHVENQKLVKDDALVKASMGKTTTFQSFLEWGLTEYPAEHVGVILWNHGGALDGVCFDENYSNDSLTDNEVALALKNAFEAVGRTEKLDWIGYDACLMSVQDIAEMNSKYFNYMVASEEAEVGEGWAYNRWIDDLYEHKSTEEVLTEICDGFIDSVDDLADYYAKFGYEYENNQNLAVIDLNKMETYKNSIESLASKIKVVVSSNKTSFRTTMRNVKSYADMELSSSDYQLYMYYGYPSSWFTNVGNETYVLHGYFSYGTFDALDMLNKMESSDLLSSYVSDIQAAKEALVDCIYYNKKGSAAGESNGLCAVVPMDNRFVYSAGYTNFINWRGLFAK